MDNFEKLGSFYLGKQYNTSSHSIEDDLVLYDSKDLTTHAVCVGMTGSGKTGLCISLLEEAAIDSIPSIIIDPKGDITNLLLTFPNLSPEEFLPWINKSEARKKGLTEEEYAKKQAALWKSGLAKWGEDANRIKKLKDSAEFNIYTPGSSAGKSISILKSFEAPNQKLLEDTDWFADKIESTTSSLLGLLGIDADPITSREHILLSNIFKFYWEQSIDLDLTKLIESVQNPPITKIGVMDIESFFPSKDRFKLAMGLNNLLSSPSFQSWLEGEALDVGGLLYTYQGNPKVSIFYIAHLSDTERMFFVSLLLNNILEWMRLQSGTTSLRALLYIDELFGFMPPISNPPSKKPLLTLMKQARAFGLGVMLATQNPIDLDYKSLSNAGTWFIGRLQTKQDVDRVLSGLQGSATESGISFNRKNLETLLSNLDKRVFLLNNVHEENPIIFHTRWAMSYLRGPLTRTQIKKLTKPSTKTVNIVHKPSMNKKSIGSNRPALPTEITQLFIPYRGKIEDGNTLLYRPFLYSGAEVNFRNQRRNIDLSKPVQLMTLMKNDVLTVNFNDSEKLDVELSELSKKPEKNIQFDNLPRAAANKKNYALWEKDFKEFLYRTYFIELLKSPTLNLTSRPNESAKDFKIRLRQIARERRDEWIEKKRKTYAKKIDALQTKIKRAADRIQIEESQSKQQKLQAAISFGATLLGAFLGRKAVSRSTIGKAGTTIRSAGRVIKESQDVNRAKENLRILNSKLQELQNSFQEEVDGFTEKFDISTEEFEKVLIRPKKSDIDVTLVSLLWAPYKDENGTLEKFF
ncbi:AAA-like domain protein [bacterium BMS3Abin04]|nr:AAA-like domain protein [bacterium BMS3Abin04]